MAWRTKRRSPPRPPAASRCGGAASGGRVSAAVLGAARLACMRGALVHAYVQYTNVPVHAHAHAKGTRGRTHPHARRAVRPQVLQGEDSMPEAARGALQAACTDLEGRFPSSVQQLLRTVWPGIVLNQAEARRMQVRGARLRPCEGGRPALAWSLHAGVPSTCSAVVGCCASGMWGHGCAQKQRWHEYLRVHRGSRRAIHSCMWAFMPPAACGISPPASWWCTWLMRAVRACPHRRRPRRRPRSARPGRHT